MTENVPSVDIPYRDVRAGFRNSKSKSLHFRVLTIRAGGAHRPEGREGIKEQCSHWERLSYRSVVRHLGSPLASYHPPEDTLKDSHLVRAKRLMAHANVPSRTLRPEAIG
jgi:hypothetical protein